MQATELLGAGLVVPIHWGTFSPLGLRRGRPGWVDAPVHRFRDGLRHAGVEDLLRVLEPGGQLVLDPPTVTRE